jgi:hypothetical protein
MFDYDMYVLVASLKQKVLTKTESMLNSTSCSNTILAKQKSTRIIIHRSISDN